MHRSWTACVDASVTLPFIVGPRNEAVEHLWGFWRTERASLVAPRLLRYEVVNGVHRLRVAGVISETSATEGIRTLLDLPITLFDDDSLHESAAMLAHQFSLPATYDAHYLALAQHLSCAFWTADRRLVRTVQPNLPWVRLLEY